MFSDTYLARVNEVADRKLAAGPKLMANVLAGLDEILVDVFARPRDEWADTLRELQMPRTAAAVDQALPRQLGTLDG